MSKLSVNCGSAAIFSYKPEIFDAYDEININSGSVIFSAKAYEQLSKKKLSVNAGSSRIIEVTGTVVQLGETVLLKDNTDYSGCFLVAETLVICPAALPGLTDVKGIYAETVFCPHSALSQLGKLILAETLTSYPDGAEFRLGAAELDSSALGSLEDGQLLFVSGRLHALDADALEEAQKRGLRFESKALRIYAGLWQTYGSLFTAGNVQVIPDGYAIVKGDMPLRHLQAVYGEKLYVTGSLTITEADEAALKALEGLAVEKQVSVPLGLVKTLKAKGEAGSIFPYEGSLLAVNGSETINHEQLAAAQAAGQRFTISVNGHLGFAPDVTPEDLNSIAALRYNGMVQAEGALLPLLKAKVTGANGTMMETRQVEEAAGARTDSANTINMGSWVVV